MLVTARGGVGESDLIGCYTCEGERVDDDLTHLLIVLTVNDEDAVSQRNMAMQQAHLGQGIQQPMSVVGVPRLFQQDVSQPIRALGNLNNAAPALNDPVLLVEGAVKARRAPDVLGAIQCLGKDASGIRHGRAVAINQYVPQVSADRWRKPDWSVA